ncbi:hypothetical protein D9M71_656320 [compost metagenome]
MHVDVGWVEQVVIDFVFDIVAGDGLQQDALGQAHALLVQKFVGGGDLAPGNAAQVGNKTLDFSDLVFLQPVGQSIQIAFHNAS